MMQSFETECPDRTKHTTTLEELNDAVRTRQDNGTCDSHVAKKRRDRWARVVFHFILLTSLRMQARG